MPMLHFWDSVLNGLEEKFGKRTVFCFNQIKNKQTQNEIQTIIANSTAQDLVFLGSLMDLSPVLKTSLFLLNQLHKKGCKVLIHSISPVLFAEKYLPQLFEEYNFDPENPNPKRTRKTKYPLELLEYAASLRQKNPPVCYQDITTYTGINRTTLIEYLNRTGQASNKKLRGRSITDEEYTILRNLSDTLTR